jgi:glutamate carboxypeptidase
MNKEINPKEIEQFLESKLITYLDYLHQMVSINSFTANRDGVNRLGEYTSSLFSGLGLMSRFHQSKYSGYGKHLFMTFTDTSDNVSLLDKPTIIMVSHLDTVFPPDDEILNKFFYQLSGDRIYGPGTVDIKGGTLMIYIVLDVFKTFFPDLLDSVYWVIALDASEEALSDDFTQLIIDSKYPNPLACLIFEGGTPFDGQFPLVIARKGRASFSVTAHGKSAHSGNFHHKGVNAIVQLAYTILNIASFTDYINKITFNVGVVSGGDVVNRVPNFAKAEVELRAFDPSILQDGIDKMVSLDGSSNISSQDGYPSKISIKMTGRTNAWPENKSTKSLYELWEKVSLALGYHVSTEMRGGLSDGNLLWHLMPTLDGLGPSGDNAHCSERSDDGSKEQEYALVSSFIPKALINIQAIYHLILDYKLSLNQ